MAWFDDHDESLENGGSNEDHNRQLLCGPCHAKKYPDDRAKAAKTKRKFTKSVIPTKQRQKKSAKIPSRPFTGWRRFNGDKVIKRYSKDTDD